MEFGNDSGELMRKASSIVVVSIYAGIIVLPLILAIQRLVSVTGLVSANWFGSLDENYISHGVLEFTIVQAFFSTLLTLVIGIPIAWTLGRYKWRFESLIRTILTMPFVIPSIIAAMGFLTIIGPHGLDIRTNESTWWSTLIISHAWFNMALVIRFCEPVLSTIDPKLEEQLRLLPNGKTAYSRFLTQKPA